MKKIVLFFAMIFISGLVMAQSSNVRKADRALEKGELQEAKELINEATQNEKTKDDGKTWYTKGTIYQALLNKEYSEEYLKEAVKSYKKVMELEKEGSNYYTLTDLKMQELWGKFINKGSESYSANEFEAAQKSFERAAMVLPNDTTAALYAGISAQQAENTDAALKHYYKLIELDYHSADIYNSIISIERYINKDVEQALEVIEMAQKQFPEDDSFEKQEINILIESERIDEAKEKIAEAITQDPNNANLYFNLGYLHEELKQPEKAEEAYKAAVELDPDYLDANYNLAVFYYNKAADLFAKSRDMDLEEYRKKGKKVEAEAKEYLKKAKPYFEKAHELAPEEIVIIETLQTVYMQLGETEKAEKMLEKADAIKAKNEGN